MGARILSDEAYVIDICDKVLRLTALRGHRFPFLVGDSGRTLPVDAFYPSLKLVVEYRERQHTEAVPIFDRKPTLSGVPRGVQRALYDQRRRDVLPANGLRLVELDCSQFQLKNAKHLKRTPKDIGVVRAALSEWCT